MRRFLDRAGALAGRKQFAVQPPDYVPPKLISFVLPRSRRAS